VAATHAGRLRLPRRHFAAPGDLRLQILILFLALLASGLVGDALAQRLVVPPAPVTPATAAVSRGTVQTVINATGSLAASSQSKLGYITAGKLAELYVKVGDTVQAGQPIAKLDTTDLESKLAQAQTGLRQAQRKLDTLLQPAKPEDIAAVQAQVAAAQAKLDEVRKGPTQADLTDAQQKTVAAQAQLAKAQNDLATLQAGPAQADVQPAQQKVAAAQAQLLDAQNKLATLQAGPSPADLLPLQAAVHQKQAALDTARANYDAALAKSGTVSPTLTLALQQAQTDLQVAQNNLAAKTAPPSAADLQAAQNNVRSA
jgi:HlyD family secretion protein